MSEPRPRPATPPPSGLAISGAALRALLAARNAEEDSRIAAELASLRERTELRERLAERFGRVTDVYELGRLILREAQEQLGYAHGMLALVGEDPFLEVAASTEAVPPSYRAELLEEAFIVGEALTLGPQAEALAAMGNADVPPGITLVARPFTRQDGAPLGVLLLEGEPVAARAAWLDDLLAIVAEAIEDCRAYGRLEALLVDGAIALARVHEAREPAQAGHVDRVEVLAIQLARRLGLGETAVKRTRMLALLHDMTADEVTAGFQALRRGKLTGASWRAELTTPFVGGIYASPLADFQALLGELRYVRCRWDGKGNDPPSRGAELPIAARIVAVAEAFEHLTGARRHRTTLAIPTAVAEIARFAGAQYDPGVVHALAELFAEVEREGRVGVDVPHTDAE